MLKKILSLFLFAVLVVCTPLVTLAVSPGFSDISGHWAQNEIEEAAAAGWVNGYPDGTFRPDDTITRAEFVKMLMSAIHLTPGSETAKYLIESSQLYLDQQAPLTDLDTHWLTKDGWTQPALAFGLIVSSDYSNSYRFEPDSLINRYDTAVMAVRALGLVYPAAQPEDKELFFSDKELIPNWAKGYLKETVTAGVVKGYPDGRFGGSSTATRAEAVVMVQRVLQYMETGIDKDINVFVETDDRKTGPIQTTAVVPAQMIDGRLFVSARDIFNAWAKLYDREVFYTRWNPLQQQLKLSFMLESTFGAGDKRYEAEGFWQNLNEYSQTFSVNARLLYGELMIPAYDPGKSVMNLWPTPDWDSTTKTLTIRVNEPAEHRS